MKEIAQILIFGWIMLISYTLLIGGELFIWSRLLKIKQKALMVFVCFLVVNVFFVLDIKVFAVVTKLGALLCQSI